MHCGTCYAFSCCSRWLDVPRNATLLKGRRPLEHAGQDALERPEVRFNIPLETAPNLDAVTWPRRPQRPFLCFTSRPWTSFIRGDSGRGDRASPLVLKKKDSLSLIWTARTWRPTWSHVVTRRWWARHWIKAQTGSLPDPMWGQRSGMSMCPGC